MSATGMWVEKYRPKEISEIVGQSEIIGSLSALIKDPTDMPHLMFSGSAGVGKTTTALCITRQILGENIEGNLLELNASDERGIGMVREKVKKFSGFAGLSNVPFKIIILDEADAMTMDAQLALRRIMDRYSGNAKFCIICNYIRKIHPALISRCSQFRFRPLDNISMKEKLEYIISLSKEDVTQVGINGQNRLLSVRNYERIAADLAHQLNIL